MKRQLNTCPGAEALSPQLCKETWGREATCDLAELEWTGQQEPLEIMPYEMVSTHFKLTPSCSYPSRADKRVGETSGLAWLRPHLRPSILQHAPSERELCC